MSRPLSNFQMRDAEALLHPYTNAVAPARDRRARHRARRGRAGLRPVRARLYRGHGRASGAAASASAMPSSSRRRARRWRSCPTITSSPRKSNEPAVELAEKIKALAPGRMARVFYQSSGSEANDTQVKLAWYYNNALGRPAKKKIIAAAEGLPRRHDRRGLADRAAEQPPRLRPAGRGRPAHLDAALLEGRRAGRERGGLLRAGSPPSSRR